MIEKQQVTKSEWPGGVSDGLVCRCSMCGHLPEFDYRVDDELWRQVVPEEWRTGVVCLPCLDALAEQDGIDISGLIEFVQFTGVGKTIELAPKKVYLYCGTPSEKKKEG